MMLPNARNLKTGRRQGYSRKINQPYMRGSFAVSTDLRSSFNYAFQGIQYAISTQRNFRIHLFLGFLVSAFGVWLQLSFTHLAILVITIFAVLILELLNTSIEAVVDLTIGRRFHRLARIAKDCAAASVLLSSISAVLIAMLLFLPEILKRLGL